MTNKLLLFSVVCACNYRVTNLLWSDTCSRSRQVDCKRNEIVLSHYPRKIICAVLDVWLDRCYSVV